MGRASCCWDKREEQGWRGGGAIGTHPSRGLLFRWEDSGTEEEEDDEAEAAAGSESRQLAGPEGGEVSGPTAPCSSSPAAAACSASRVGEEGGEGRDFFLLEDNSFRRLFFSLCKMKTSIFFFFTLRRWEVIFRRADRHNLMSGPVRFSLRKRKTVVGQIPIFYFLFLQAR